jgi:hypothetical protein
MYIGFMQDARYSYRILKKLEFFQQISDFMKNHPVEAELFHADRWTDRRDEENSSFSQFCDIV